MRSFFLPQISWGSRSLLRRGQSPFFNNQIRHPILRFRRRRDGNTSYHDIEFDLLSYPLPPRAQKTSKECGT